MPYEDGGYEYHGVSVVYGNGVVWPDAAGLASGRATLVIRTMLTTVSS